jgi:RimJ/RimL family protein N-acetyltransferase
MLDPRDIFLEGKDVILKALSRDDVENSGWYGWFNDEELCKTLQKHYYPNTLDMQLKFFAENIHNAKDKLQLGICHATGGPIVGVISLNDIDFINRKAEISVLIGVKESRNISIFIEACKLIFNHAFNTLNLNRIYGASISRDLVLTMCRMLGCKEEGILRQEIYKNGKYCNAYAYSILREEFV